MESFGDLIQLQFDIDVPASPAASTGEGDVQLFLQVSRS
jgi:hypothetical protein